MAKNLCAKTRPVDRPYEIWERPGWVYRVLKKNQNPEAEAKNPYALWFVSCDSPWVDDERGDTYAADIKNSCVMTASDYDGD